MIHTKHHFAKAILFFSAITAWGQSFSGRIAGVVTDTSSAAIPRAAVTVINEGTATERRLLTDTSGGFVAAQLPVGYYTVRFEAPGMMILERRSVKVDVGAETRADATLAPAAMPQSVDEIGRASCRERV